MLTETNNELASLANDAPRGTLTVVADEIAKHAKSAGQGGSDVWTWRTWEQWATARGLPAGPATEQDIARFLVAHRHRWRGATMRNVVASINRRHADHQWPRPANELVRRLIVAVERLEGVSTAEPRPALLPVVAGAILCELSTWRPIPTALIGLVLIRRGVDLIDIPDVDPADIRQTRIGWRLGTTRAGITLRKGHGAERDAGQTIAGLAAGGALIGTLDQVTGKVRATLERAGLPAPSSPLQLADAIRRLDDEEFTWLVQWCDPTLARRLRNRALIGVGVAAARRGAELSRIERRDITPLDDGWYTIFRQHKTALTGDRPIERVVGHIGDDADPCDATCPACALGDWLTLSDRRSPNRPTAAAFPARLYRCDPPAGHLTTQAIRYLVRGACAGIDGAPARVGSSGLRVGGATGAYLAGMAPADIAANLTGQTIDMLPRYIRLQAPDLNTYRLPL